MLARLAANLVPMRQVEPKAGLGINAVWADHWREINPPDSGIPYALAIKSQTKSCMSRFFSSAEAVMAKAEVLGQAWLRGVASELVRKLLREQPT